MKRYTILSAALSLMLFLGTIPALAQTVALADAGAVTDGGGTHALAERPALQIGLPALRKPMPAFVYPVKAERFHIEGRVLVEYIVNERGHARDIRILKGPGGGCEEEVQRVLRATRFQPILNADGQPAEARFLSAFDFRLK